MILHVITDVVNDLLRTLGPYALTNHKAILLTAVFMLLFTMSSMGGPLDRMQNATLNIQTTLQYRLED